MNIQINASDELVTVYLTGEIDHHSAGEIREEIDRSLESNRPKQLVMDFKNVGFMDSSGIGLVMGRYKLMQTMDGDVKIIKNAGGEINHPFGSAVRSLLVAIYELGVEEILVIGHTDCGVQSMDPQEMIEMMKARGVSEKQLAMMDFCGIDFKTWLRGFETVEKSVQESVDLLRRHPLIPKDVQVYGFVMDSKTGELYPQ